jgi:hypothetical protein
MGACVDEAARQAVIEDFHLAHERIYGRRHAEGSVQFVNILLSVTGRVQAVRHPEMAEADGAPVPLKRARTWFRGQPFDDCRAIDRDGIRAGHHWQGPRGRRPGIHHRHSTRLERPLRSLRQPADHPFGRRGMSKVLDSYRLDILSSALTALTEEIEITLLRSAYSQVVKEAQDASCAIFTAEGRIVAQPVVIPGHLGSMKYMLAACLETFPAKSLSAGDVLISNDPYQGGSHLPDIALFRPVFHDGVLIAFAGCIIHYTDVGGMVPGSNPQRATELYQEGLVLPPMKLQEAGKPNETLRALIRANVRNPHIFFGDLSAQEAAMLTGERRMLQLVERFGVDSIRQAMDMLIDITAQKARAEVAAMKRGSYVFEDFMDHDGINLDKPIGIRVRLDVTGDKLRSTSPAPTRR